MATLTKSTGTVTLSGAAEKVTFPAVYGWVWIKNMSESDIFAGLSADISEGADGVMVIPAGDAGRIQTDGQDSVYLIGTGNALVVAQNYADCPFKSGAKGGGTDIGGESSYSVKNAVDYPLLGLTVYGKSVQDGVPTPENPMEIVSVGDSGSVAVQACGKNLLNSTLKTTTINGLTCTNNGDGTYTLNGTAQKDTYFCFGGINNAVIGKNYRLTCSPNPSKSTFIAYFEIGASGYEYNNAVAKGEIIRVTLVVRPNVTVNNLIVKPMITTDLTATYDDFEPYHGATANITSSMPLCGIPVDSGGNYTDGNGQQWICDELVYNADGTGKVVKRTAKIDSYNGETISTLSISTTGSLSTGATVIYQIAEPQEIELTAAEMTALRQVQTYNGITNISNDGGADMGVTYCTNKTLSEYVMPITTGLQAQIDELKAAVLSLGGNV